MGEPTTPSFVPLPGIGSPITELALQLVAVRGDHVDPAGTATVVAPHLAITAAHVIQDYWRTYERGAEPRERVENRGSFVLTAIQIMADGRMGALYDITRIKMCSWADLAVMMLTPQNDAARSYRWPGKTRMALVSPRVGSRVSAFGYHGAAARRRDPGIEIRRDASTSHGEVVEVHPRGRDSSSLPWPCFRTNARFDGGMSGGPVSRTKAC